MMAPALALAQMSSPSLAASPDRPRTHPVLVGAGVTWTDPGTYDRSTHPAAMLGLDLALGTYAAIGLLGDVTRIDQPPYGLRHRVLTGLDLKLLPYRNSVVRPWVAASAALSLVDDTGYGMGLGAGVFFVPNERASPFLDVRRYRFYDFESPQYNQVMFRGGVAF